MLMFDGVRVDVHGSTDVGRARQSNQDQFLIAALHKVVEIHGTSIPQVYRDRFHSGARALLLLVADGVGGRKGGDEASSLTLDAITDYVTNSMRCFYKLDEQIPLDLLAELAATVERSHASVLERAGQQPERAGMATTLTMAHVLWPRVYIVHIGDSRCYHVRDSELTQVTRDQTLVQELIDMGALTEEDAKRSPLGHVLSQAIGHAEEIQPEITKVEVQLGDTLLLCTDGLTAHLSNEEIAEHLRAAESAEAACDSLITTALERGGRDNVTVVVGRFA
ncbi:MAG: protein phosphatase 2C domain-containing protein [Gemmatimonadales bacterium]|jgi:protein phosphatase